MKKYMLILLVLLIGLGCSRPPQMRYFTLDVIAERETDTPSELALWIKDFDCEDIYSQDRLVVKKSRYEIQFDHYRRWVQPPSVLIQHKMVDFLQESGVFSLVTDEAPMGMPFVVLSCKIQQFEEVYENGQHFIDAKFLFNLVDMARETHDSFTIQSQVPITMEKTESIIEAYSKATENVLSELIDEIYNLN